ncbi:unnamed protein product, partial [Prorocentrum cordatum]
RGVPERRPRRERGRAVHLPLAGGARRAGARAACEGAALVQQRRLSGLLGVARRSAWRDHGRGGRRRMPDAEGGGGLARAPRTAGWRRRPLPCCPPCESPEGSGGAAYWTLRRADGPGRPGRCGEAPVGPASAPGGCAPQAGRGERTLRRRGGVCGARCRGCSCRRSCRGCQAAEAQPRGRPVREGRGRQQHAGARAIAVRSPGVVGLAGGRQRGEPRGRGSALWRGRLGPAAWAGDEASPLQEAGGGVARQAVGAHHGRDGVVPRRPRGGRVGRPGIADRAAAPAHGLPAAGPSAADRLRDRPRDAGAVGDDRLPTPGQGAA